MPFPKDFRWGVATSAYQIEGAANEDGRGESIWDRFAHTPGTIKDGSSGDIACDHYHRYATDVALLRELNLNTYRFSVAWPRILPNGTGQVNQLGLDFYSRLVDTLLEANITPFLTLYHWDLPQALQNHGGWNSRTTAYAFAHYAQIVAQALGDRVPLWITHNEPWCTAFLGYHMGIFAPGIEDLKIALQVSHHVMLSHGLAVAALRSALPATAQIGYAPNYTPAYPAPGSHEPEDERAARLFDGHFNRWFIDPVAGRGYPQDLWSAYGPLVPEVQDGDLDTIAAPIDFLGLNYYNPTWVVHDPDQPTGLGLRANETLEQTADREIYAPGMYDMLLRVHHDYHFPNLYITENGAAFDDRLSTDGQVRDTQRIRFLQAHFAQAERALAASIPLRGYCVWSLCDNFEWAAGYTLRYGLTYVDFETQQRTIKQSGRWYADLIRQQQG